VMKEMKKKIMGFKKDLEKSKEKLRNKTAEELMTEAGELHRKIIQQIVETDLTPVVIVGVLENIKNIIFSELKKE